MQRYCLTLKEEVADGVYIELAFTLKAAGYAETSKGVFVADDYLGLPEAIEVLFAPSWLFDSLDEMKTGPRKYSPQEIVFFEALPPAAPLSTPPLPIED